MSSMAQPHARTRTRTLRDYPLTIVYALLAVLIIALLNVSGLI